MKFDPIDPPRTFEVGKAETEIIRISDCAHVRLAADEQVTFMTEAGGEYDVLRKNWGFFATPSLNGRLGQFGLRTALVKSLNGRYFIVLVEKGHEPEFQRYVELHEYAIVCWMDSTESLEMLEAKLKE